MWNMKHLAVAVAITLSAGFTPLMLVASPGSVFIAKVATAILIIGFAIAVTLYFMHESAAALTLRDEDFHWH